MLFPWLTLLPFKMQGLDSRDGWLLRGPGLVRWGSSRCRRQEVGLALEASFSRQHNALQTIVCLAKTSAGGRVST